MIQLSGPACLHHDHEIRLSLTTMHSDLGQPDQLVGLFECPECGDQRRLPLAPAGEAPVETLQAEVA